MAISQKPNRPHRPPVAILVDRSRDLLAGRSLVHLEPDDRYQTTDSRVPLTAGMLARYDVLAIVGQARRAYSRRQTDAIVQFVRGGGGLLLTDTYRLTLYSGETKFLADLSANRLDGELNAGGAEPSGDGESGGDYIRTFRVLYD